MKPPADADTPAPARGDADSGSGMKIALGVVVFLLFVEFALPGFVAAGFSRMGGGSLCEEVFGLRAVHYVWIDSASTSSGASLAVRVILWPAFWLMDHSEPVSRFYMWEFHLAGGQERLRAD